MKRYLLLCSLFSFFLVNVSGQRERFYEDEDDQSSYFFYDANIGNIYFSNQFSISAKGAAGYKLSEQIGVGIHTKFFYNLLILQNNPDVGLFSYGAGVFGRALLGRSFFIQAEYNATSYESSTITGLQNRSTETYPLFGGGYLAGTGDWKFGLTMLFIADEQVREIRGESLEYWITATYNF